MNKSQRQIKALSLRFINNEATLSAASKRKKDLIHNQIMAVVAYENVFAWLVLE
jgi:hypothetical protein